METHEFADVAFRFFDLGLTGVGLSFTIVSAYVAALYLFLHRAPLFLRFISFVFFTGVLSTLGVVVYNSCFFLQAIQATATEIVAEHSASLLTQRIAQATLKIPLDMLLPLPWVLGASMYMTLAYFTFFYDWRSFDAEQQRDAVMAAAEEGLAVLPVKG